MGRQQQLLRYVATAGGGPAQVFQALDDASPEVTGTDFATLGDVVVACLHLRGEYGEVPAVPPETG